LNGSTARVYKLAMTGAVKMHIIGSDGGLLRSPETVSEILLGPGERLDVLVDFSQLAVGKEAYLVSNSFSKYSLQGRQTFKLMKVKVDRAASSDFTLPSSLSHIAVLDHMQAVQTRTFNISSMAGGE